MPLTDEISLVSVDDHICEPPDVWTARLPRRFQESGPRVVELDDDVSYNAGLPKPLLMAPTQDHAPRLGDGVHEGSSGNH